MSYQTAKWVTPWEGKSSKMTWLFSWWYVDNAQNQYMLDKFSPYLRNARSDAHFVSIRPWHQLFKTLTTWSYPKWIWSYLRSDSNNDVIVVRHNQSANHKLVTITESWTLTSIDTSTNIASDNRMNFINIGDVIYCMNWSDNFGKLSWTTYTTPSTWISNFAPSFSVAFNSSHWASGRSTNSNKVYKSVWDNYEDFNSTWSDIFTFEENVTGLLANTEWLFYFTKNTISVTWQNDITNTNWTITYATRKLTVKEWAVNHNSIVSVWTDIYYLTPNNNLNKLIKGQSIYWYEELELSQRRYAWISTIMQTLDPDQTASFGYFLPKENIIKWFVKSYWATFNDICIVYDTIKDAFFIDTQKHFYWWIVFHWNYYTISMIEPKVYQDEFWQDDEWSLIPFEYWTKEFYFTDPTYKKIFWESRTMLDINSLATLTQQIVVDWVIKDTKTITWTSTIWDNIITTWNNIIWDWDTYWSLFTPIWWIWVDPIWETPIGEAPLQEDMNETYILRTRWNLNVKWKKIQFRFTNNSLAGKVRLRSIILLIEVLPPIQTALNP